MDAGVPVRGLGGRMTQDIADYLEWASGSQQPCGKCVPEQVDAPPTNSSVEASTLKRSSHVRRQVVLRSERFERCAVPQKDGAVR